MSVWSQLLELATEIAKLVRGKRNKRPPAPPPELEDGERHRLERKLRATDEARKD